MLFLFPTIYLLILMPTDFDFLIVDLWEQDIQGVSLAIVQLKRNVIYKIAALIAEQHQVWKWTYTILDNGFRLKGNMIHQELYLKFKPSWEEIEKLELRNEEGAVLDWWTDSCEIWKSLSWHDRMNEEGFDFILHFIEQAIPKPTVKKTICEPRKIDNMPNYYCQHCGQRYTSVVALTSCNCPRHPEGANKGKHSLYQGTEKTKYCCKYCGQFYASIFAMTSVSCHRHPHGANKGKHAPAL